ncbi:MAG: hypothetical protein M3Q10_17170 [Chloroflexota bacterium]|nr:hypothetical protein [Chloroflexota bacterium]
MTRFDRRLRLVASHLRPAPPPSSFDPARLDPDEWKELDGILARYAPAPGDSWPFARMSDDELDRACELARKAEGLPPEPAYYAMNHRDGRIGPCRCTYCERKGA